MPTIDVYLAHRNSNKFMQMQVILVRKYFKYNEGSKINIYGFVDGSTNEIKGIIYNLWVQLGVNPIDIPRVINGQDRNHLGPSESFGLAFTFTYQKYILQNKNISVFMENDIFPFTDINIEDYVKDYEICGEVRFNAAQLPDRNVMFWLGFIIFNGSKMNDREIFSGLCEPIINIESGKQYWIDSGGQSYYWIKKAPRNIRQMVTNGNENYNGFSSLECTPHNITTDLQNLPVIFRENYQPQYHVLIYDKALIHLERMGKENDPTKNNWWLKCFNKIINPPTIYIPIGFQCTSAQILKKLNKRICGFPFDWIISNPEAIFKILNMLLQKNCDISSLVKTHFFKINNMLRFIIQEEFIDDIHGNILYNSDYNLIYPHFKNNIETVNKLIDRFGSLRDYILNYNEKLVFLYINRLVNNSNETVDINKTKLIINNKYIQFNLIENLNKICLLLDNYISQDRYIIKVINAVEKINMTEITSLHTNINYHEMVPKNNDNLTDEEIMTITI